MIKTVLKVLLCLALGVLLYIPCRQAAVLERGSLAYGGEVLIPLAIWFGAFLVHEWLIEEKENVEDGERGKTNL